MKAFRLLIAPVVLSVGCATAQAELTVEQVGSYVLGNSWSITQSVGNLNAWDRLQVDMVSGETFEVSPPTIVTQPGWTGTRVSSSQVILDGTAFLGGLNFTLTFDGAAPPATFGGVQIQLSVYAPGAENAYDGLLMVWDPGKPGGAGFIGAGQGSITTQTRTGTLAAPIPGAVFLGMMGFGLVGLARKRLH